MTAPPIHDARKFADLGPVRHIWAVAAVHADLDRLSAVHQTVWRYFRPGDRLVYLGNLIGHGPRAVDTLNTVLAFRRALISLPGMKAEDVVYLRGAQEEMWQKLLQLQFAPNPRDVLEWMLNQGVDGTLAAYGGSVEQGMAAARGGTMTLGRWTQALRTAMQSCPGHSELFSALRRAAYTHPPADGAPDGAGADGDGVDSDGTGVLLVSAGLDPARPFSQQGDRFWWGGGGFARLDRPYAGFRRVVRGWDPGGGGVSTDGTAVTLDAGCGRGGPLVCGILAPDGAVLETFHA